MEFSAAQGFTIADAEGVAELPVVGRFLGRRRDAGPSPLAARPRRAGLRGGLGAAGRGRRAAAGLRSPLYLGGLGCDGVAWLLSLLALRRLPTFAVQSLLAGSLALTVLLARVFLGVAAARAGDTAAVLLLVAALAVVGGSGTEQPSPATGSAVDVGLCAARGPAARGASWRCAAAAPRRRPSSRDSGTPSPRWARGR